MRKEHRDDNGFTLVELLVVIAIIGILATIAIPQMIEQRRKGVDATIRGDLANASKAAEVWITDNPTEVGPGDSTGWVSAPYTSGGVGFTRLADVGFRPSNGNRVRITTVANVGYCIEVYHPVASAADSASTPWRYDSAGGGLIAGNTPVASGACS